MTRWSPFADSQFHVEWAGATAMAWVWSRGRVLGGDDPMQLADPPRRLVPESLYRARPEADGEQLVAMDRGYEGRIWRDHRLVASEWWPGLPALGDWNLFRRGGGLAPVDALPDINEGTLADSTWSAPRTLGLAEVATRHRSLLAAMAIGVVVAVLAMQLVAAISLRVSIWQVENQIAVQDEGLQRILAAREAAGRDVDAIESLLALRPPAGQVELLATVIDLLPASGWRMLEWRMPDVGTLEVDLFMPNPDPSALVQAWEASGRFEAVTVELGSSPDEVSIRAGVVRAPATRGAP